MDLATLDVRAFAAKGAEVEWYHPVTRMGIGVFFNVIGRDADAYQAWVFQRAEEKAAEQQARNRARVGPANQQEFTAENFYNDQVEDAAFCLRGWSEKTADGSRQPSITVDGTTITYGKESANAQLRRFPWMLEQVLAAAANRGVFMPASATN